MKNGCLLITTLVDLFLNPKIAIFIECALFSAVFGVLLSRTWKQYVWTLVILLTLIAYFSIFIYEPNKPINKERAPIKENYRGNKNKKEYNDIFIVRMDSISSKCDCDNCCKNAHVIRIAFSVIFRVKDKPDCHYDNGGTYGQNYLLIPFK